MTALSACVTAVSVCVTASRASLATVFDALNMDPGGELAAVAAAGGKDLGEPDVVRPLTDGASTRLETCEIASAVAEREDDFATCTDD